MFYSNGCSIIFCEIPEFKAATERVTLRLWPASCAALRA